jgi:glycosyltransferase involved in cell wall biosynthesis|tara:strand:+ start:3849 stop:5003 length:1155 start_codon:yes stop_codon:yes gene_type:complete
MKEKVLHVITGLNNGGAEGALCRLCTNSQLYQHVVVSLIDGGVHEARLKEAGVLVYCLGFNRAWMLPWVAIKLFVIVCRERPSLMQTWMYHADFVGGIVARFAFMRRIFWGIRHSSFEKGGSSKSTVILAKVCASMSSFLPSGIICCANSAARLHESIGYDGNKMSVIHNGYDLNLLNFSSSGRSIVRREIGIPDESFLIGMVARFNPQKDHANLIAALGIVKRKFLSFRCVLVGPGVDEDNDALCTLLENHNLKDDVVLLGARADVANIMSSLDVHVLSSAFGEAFPNVLAEAMACQTPCIATDVGDSSFIIDSHGWIVPPRQPQLLALSIEKAMREAVSFPADWAARRQECSNRIKNNFSVEAMVNKFEAVWSSNSDNPGKS